MQVFTVTDSLAPVNDRLQATLRSLAHRERLVAALAALGTTVAAALVAPSAGPHVWDWVRLVLILGGGTVAGAALASVGDDLEGDFPLLAVALGGTMVAVGLSATFGLRTATLCSLGLTVVDAACLSARLRGMPELPVAALGVLIPLWVWSALGVWDNRLWLLVPLAALALNADAHARLALPVATSHRGDQSGGDLDPLSPAGHRLGVWLSLSAAAVLLLVTGAVSGVDGGWIAAGSLLSIGVIAGGSTDQRVRLSDGSPVLRPLSLLAFGVLGLCWLAGL